MKELSVYISGLLSLLMIAAIVLPSLHTLTHDLNQKQSVYETHISNSPLDCDLCDFQFSPLETSVGVEFDPYHPIKESVLNISLAQTVHLFPNSLFSLRAPPARIA